MNFFKYLMVLVGAFVVAQAQNHAPQYPAPAPAYAPAPSYQPPTAPPPLILAGAPAQPLRRIINLAKLKKK